MEVQGTIKVIGETATFGATGFRKRELVITTDEQYPQTIMVEFVQDKCDLLDKFEVGKNVKIGINLRGREWTNPQGETKYFNSIQGWNINSFVTEGDKNKLHAPLMTEAQKEAIRRFTFLKFKNKLKKYIKSLGHVPGDFIANEISLQKAIDDRPSDKPFVRGGTFQNRGI